MLSAPFVLFTFVWLEEVGSSQCNTVHIRQHALSGFVVVVRRSATMFLEVNSGHIYLSFYSV